LNKETRKARGSDWNEFLGIIKFKLQGEDYVRLAVTALWLIGGSLYFLYAEKYTSLSIFLFICFLTVIGTLIKTDLDKENAKKAYYGLIGNFICLIFLVVVLMIQINNDSHEGWDAEKLLHKNYLPTMEKILNAGWHEQTTDGKDFYDILVEKDYQNAIKYFEENYR